MILVVLLLPLLFVLSLMAGHSRAQYRGMITFGSTHFLIAAFLFYGGSDPFPVVDALFHLTPLNSTFLLAHTGLQMVAFLSLPRSHRTRHHLLGALLLSLFSVATICAKSHAVFLFSFVLSLFVPYVLARMETSSGKRARIFLILGLLCALLTFVGVWLGPVANPFALSIPLLLAASIRLGFVPFHLWVRRMVLGFPIQWSVLYFLSYPSIALFLNARLNESNAPIYMSFLTLAAITTGYGAWLAVVQRELRAAFYYLLMSFLGAIGVGLAMASSSEALSGVLLFWFSGSLAVAGFGLVIEILEARFGRISIDDARGLIRHVPALAAIFLLFGLASVGFPGLCAFIGEEVMLSGIYAQSSWAVLPVLFALSLNGITVLRWFCAVFFGPGDARVEEIDLLQRERVAFFFLLAIIVGTGLFPRPLFQLGEGAAQATTRVEATNEPSQSHHVPHSADGHAH